MNPGIPHELAAGDVYFSPFLMVAAIALIATWITTIVLNKTRISRFILFPSTTFLEIMVLYIALIDGLLIKI